MPVCRLNWCYDRHSTAAACKAANQAQLHACTLCLAGQHPSGMKQAATCLTHTKSHAVVSAALNSCSLHPALPAHSLARHVQPAFALQAHQALQHSRHKTREHAAASLIMLLCHNVMCCCCNACKTFHPTAACIPSKLVLGAGTLKMGLSPPSRRIKPPPSSPSGCSIVCFYYAIMEQNETGRLSCEFRL